MKEKPNEFVRFYEVPWLPDFLFDHTLLASGQRDRLLEHLQRWRHMLSSLWLANEKDQHTVGFGLTILWNPKFKKTHLLASVSGSTEEAFASACYRFNLAMDTLRIPLIQKDSRFRLPLGGIENCIFEIRQWEGATETAIKRVNKKKLYIADGWRGPGGVFTVPFAALAMQSYPVLIHNCISPTRLTDEESAAFAQLAVQLGFNATRQQSQGGVSREKSDFQLVAAARAMDQMVNRLDYPFTTQSFVVSPDLDSSKFVAQSMCALINSETPFGESQDNSDSSQKSRAMLVELNSQADRVLADSVIRSNIPNASLKPHPNRPSEVQRLPHLIDARGAATCFRFPVSVNAGLNGIEFRQLPPGFEPGPDVLASNKKASVAKQSPRQSVRIGDLKGGRELHLPLSTLTRHVLINGFTGSGKTETTLNIVHQLWNDCHVPFMVIEPAKKEYRGLKTVSDWRKGAPEKNGHRSESGLTVFTIGDETDSPLRMNPLQPMPGARVEVHMGRILTCLEAALPQFGVLPSILMEALERSYRDYGWIDLTQTVLPDCDHPFPVIGDLVRHSVEVIEDRKYSSEVSNNLQGAIRSRLYPLQAGGIGKMLNTHTPVDPALLFERPTIIEMSDLRSHDRELLSLLLLVQLREYRESKGPKSDLQHVVVIEEAHNIFPRTEDRTGMDTSNAKYQTVQELSNMLAEMRAYGQGVIIADQSPFKVAPDAMRNTATQIVHQLRDGDDRAAMSNAMVMSKQQEEFLAKLLPGEAAMFTIGLQRTTFMTVPRYKPVNCEDEKSLGQGYEHGYNLRAELASTPSLSIEIKEGDLVSELLGSFARQRIEGEVARIPRETLEAVGLNHVINQFTTEVERLFQFLDVESKDSEWTKVMNGLADLAVKASKDLYGELTKTNVATNRAISLALFQSLWACAEQGKHNVPEIQIILPWIDEKL